MNYNFKITKYFFNQTYYFLFLVMLALAELRRKYDKVEKLLAIEDPVETPYKSKYEARDLLEELVGEFEKSEFDDANAISIHLLARLGSVDHDVEELTKSEIDLQKALEIKEQVSDLAKIVIPILVCYNQVIKQFTDLLITI